MSETSRVLLSVVNGPNEGQTVTVERGTCRLFGRRVSKTETISMAPGGNRALDEHASNILARHLDDRSQPKFQAEAFERKQDVILDDESISRAHAMVFFDHAGLGIIDLASTNGTFVNDERVGMAFVHEGDVVKVGQSELRAEFL